MEQQPYQPYRIDPPTLTTVTKPKQSKMGTVWKFRLGFFAIAGLFALVSSQWKIVDKYFPALNRVIHSGTPSTNDDIEYHAGLLEQDEEKLNSACKDEMDFTQCRSAVLAAKPALDGMHQHFQALVEGWEHEKGERTVPTACQQKMTQHITAYRSYLAVEDRYLAFLQSIDPSAKEGIKAAVPYLSQIGTEEDAALKALRESDTSSVCAGY